MTGWCKVELLEDGNGGRGTGGGGGGGTGNKFACCACGCQDGVCACGCQDGDCQGAAVMDLAVVDTSSAIFCAVTCDFIELHKYKGYRHFPRSLTVGWGRGWGSLHSGPGAWRTK